jgi:hypothetical protein
MVHLEIERVTEVATGDKVESGGSEAARRESLTGPRVDEVEGFVDGQRLEEGAERAGFLFVELGIVELPDSAGLVGGGVSLALATEEEVFLVAGRFDATGGVLSELAGEKLRKGHG